MLYVVDSVTRKWLEQAKHQGQVVSSNAPDGTFAAGVNRVTELMPVLMNDITSTAPQDQKVCPNTYCTQNPPHDLVVRMSSILMSTASEAVPQLLLGKSTDQVLYVQEKIDKLIVIWEKSQTFPASMIEGFRQKLNSRSYPHATL